MVHDPKTPQMEALLHHLEGALPSAYNTPFLEPDDIAGIILFLASEASRAINGTCIVADQGLSSAMLEI
jgi:3-oxoacyl-[acyl-carrier protein] reductase